VTLPSVWTLTRTTPRPSDSAQIHGKAAVADEGVALGFQVSSLRCPRPARRVRQVLPGKVGDQISGDDHIEMVYAWFPFGEQTDWPDRLDGVSFLPWQTPCERLRRLPRPRGHHPLATGQHQAQTARHLFSVVGDVVSQVPVDLGGGWPWDARAGSLRWQEARGERYAEQCQHADRRGPTGADGRMPRRAVG
jgi:hypothetical protein